MEKYYNSVPFLFRVLIIIILLFFQKIVNGQLYYQWAKSIGGFSGSVSSSNSIATDDSGYLYITGNFQGTADFDPGPGKYNLTAIKENDIFFAKYTDVGILVWAKCIGGDDNDYGNAIEIDNSGNILITGTFSSVADFDTDSDEFLLTPNGSDIFITKYNNDGEFIWAFNLNGPGNEQSRSLDLDTAGNIYLMAEFQSYTDFDPGPGLTQFNTFGGQDIGFAKYSPDGNLIWAKSIGSAAWDHGSKIILDVAFNILITGTIETTVDFDPGPGITNLTPNGGSDIFFGKYDNNGNLILAKSFGGTQGDWGYDICSDTMFNIYLTGSFYGMADFDPGPLNSTITSNGISDAFFAKYDSNGNYIFAKNIGGSYTDGGTGITINEGGNIFVTGLFSYNADLDPDPVNTVLMNPNGVYQVFYGKYDRNGNYLSALCFGNQNDISNNSFLLTKSGKVIITGSINGQTDFDPGISSVIIAPNGMSDPYIVQFDTIGNFNWVIDVAGGQVGENSYEEGIGIDVDNNCNVYVTGEFYGTADFDPGPDTFNLTSAGLNPDIFIAKYNAIGDFIWAENIQVGCPNNVAFIAVDNENSTYITGTFINTGDFDPGPGIANLTSIGGNDIFLAKYSQDGNYLWAINIGSINGDYSSSIATDELNNVYVTGYFSGITDFDPGIGTTNLSPVGNSDVFIVKYNTSGNFIWARNIGGNSYDVGNGINVDQIGNVYITGYFNETVDFDPGTGTANLISNGSGDIFLAKYNSLGNYIWAKSIGGNSYDSGNRLALDGMGNIIVTGSFYDSVDFDPGPYTNYLASNGNSDIFITKYSTSGNYQWAKSIGGGSGEYCNGITCDSYGNITISGVFTYKVDFDPGPDIAEITGINASFDVFIAKFDANGNYLKASGFGSKSHDYSNALAVDIYGNSYITGLFYDTVDVNPDSTGGILRSAGSADIFIGMYSLAPTGINEIIKNNNEIILFPDPNNGNFSLDISGIDNDDIEINIIDLLGGVVFTTDYKITTVLLKQLHITSSDLKPGLYLISINTTQGTYHKKFIIQN